MTTVILSLALLGQVDLTSVKAKCDCPICHCAEGGPSCGCKPDKPGPIETVAKVATAPVRAMRRVCDGERCRLVPVDDVATETRPMTSVSLSTRSPPSATVRVRRGLFGRRR
jgi:hypothetical protein